MPKLVVPPKRKVIHDLVNAEKVVIIEVNWNASKNDITVKSKGVRNSNRGAEILTNGTVIQAGNQIPNGAAVVPSGHDVALEGHAVVNQGALVHWKVDKKIAAIEIIPKDPAQDDIWAIVPVRLQNSHIWTGLTIDNWTSSNPYIDWPYSIKFWTSSNQGIFDPIIRVNK